MLSIYFSLISMVTAMCELAASPPHTEIFLQKDQGIQKIKLYEKIQWTVSPNTE
jgi:hypothetical protein